MLMQIMTFVVFAGITFLAIQFMTPMLYDFWYNILRPDIADNGTSTLNSSLLTSGDLMFSSWKLLSYVIPGIIILWGILLANQKRPQEYAQ